MSERTHNLGGIATTIKSDSIALENIQPPALAGMDITDDHFGESELQHFDAAHVGFSEDNDSLHFFGPAENYASGQTLYYLAELAAERARQHIGGAMMHGAGAYIPSQERGILILGEKGAGKTSVVVALCQEAHGQLVGNDQVIVSTNSGLELVSGTQEIRIRRTAALLDPILAKLVAFDTTQNLPHWDNKKVVTPEEAGITPATDRHGVTDIVQVVIDRTLDSVFTKRDIADTQTLLFLTEKVSRHIRGIATPILTDSGTFEGFAPSLDTPKASQQRAEMVTAMVRDIGITKIYGPSATHIVASILEAS